MVTLYLSSLTIRYSGITYTAHEYSPLPCHLTVTFHDDEKKITDSQLLDLRKGIHGVQIPPRTWHSLEVHEKGTVIFEVKEGPFIPHSIGGIME